MNPAERQAKSRAARREAGAKQVSVMLEPEAATALKAFVEAGETTAGCINRLLVEANPRPDH